MAYETLIPVPGEVVGSAYAARRPQTLDGARVGVMYNSKPNAPELLGAIMDILTATFDIKKVVGMVRSEGVMLPSEQQLAEMAEQCDVVITGLGDCSSCSACTINVAVDFERRRVPAVAICTEPFLASGQAMAARHGFNGYRFVMIEHPLSSLSMDQLRERARQAVPQVLSILDVVNREDSARVDQFLRELAAGERELPAQSYVGPATGTGFPGL